MRSFLTSPASVIITIIVFIGLFLRLYRLPETMQFLGDQGRDALIARAILLEGDPAFIGPVTSVGNMYLGPLYYYFMVFPLLLTYPSPVGPAYAVAIIGGLTVWLIYRLGKDVVGRRAAGFAAFLYAIAPITIDNVRFSWNPNIIPFFSVLFLWALYKAFTKHHWYWVVLGVLFSILLQLHYITLIVGAFAGVIWLYQLVIQLKAKHVAKEFIVATLIAVLIFGVSLIPQAIYDVAHDFAITRAFSQFFVGDEQHLNSTESTLSGRYAFVSGIGMRNLVEGFRFTLSQTHLRTLFAIVVLGIGAVLWWAPPLEELRKGQFYVFGFFLFSVAFLSLYKGPLFDHYLNFVFPISFLVLGMVLGNISKWRLTWPVIFILLVALCLQSYRKYAGHHYLGTNIYMFSRTAEAIASRIPKDSLYDILLLAPNNDPQGMNYRYFLTTLGKKPLSEELVANAQFLAIISEYDQDPLLDAAPHYKYNIFPGKTIVDRFTIENGPRVVLLKR